MSKNNDEQNHDLLKRLDAIIGLLTQHIISQNKIGAGLVYKSLHDAGLTPTEIGKIVDREAKDIGATITTYEKRRMKNKNKSQNNKKETRD